MISFEYFLMKRKEIEETHILFVFNHSFDYAGRGNFKSGTVLFFLNSFSFFLLPISLQNILICIHIYTVLKSYLYFFLIRLDCRLLPFLWSVGCGSIQVVLLDPHLFCFIYLFFNFLFSIKSKS